MRNKFISFLISFIVFFIAMFLVVWVSDLPSFSDTPIKLKEKRCVIAIRDNVIPFQKFGTRLFTEPYLNAAYDKVYYFTQYDNDNKKDSFIQALNEALDDYQTVDIFLLAHGNNYYEWLTEIDTSRLKKVRMVYNTGCSGSLQSDIWLNAGVSSYVSHIGPVSISPVFYFFFLRRFISGLPLEESVNASNLKTAEAIEMFSWLVNDRERVNEIISDTKAEISGMKNFNIDTE